MIVDDINKRAKNLTGDFIIDAKKFTILYNENKFSDEEHKAMLDTINIVLSLKATRAYYKDHNGNPQWTDVVIPTQENTGLYLISGVGVDVTGHTYNTTHIKDNPGKKLVVLDYLTVGIYEDIYKGMPDGIAYLYKEDILDLAKARNL
ncbi:hypothetical protein G6M86_20895 [Agrobacterium tumefaciens]|uniref:Uncharacterized protein n=1 Tax=Agrobacterium tumefaciens TaxID=358 RepID=A0AAJ4TC93_AGRTU|nr:hypothetical protein G6M86_20895 [Agrobacterium tumefaciens]